MRIRPCINCKHNPKFYQEDGEYVISCCTEVYDEVEENAVIRWNDKNKMYFYLFGIRYHVNENEEVERSVDALVIYSEDLKDQLNACFLLSEIGNNSLGTNNLPRECIDLINNLGGVSLRRKCEDINLHLLKFPHCMSRSEFKEVVKWLDKNKIKESKINNRSIMECITS